MEEVEASMLAAAIRLSLQEAGGSGPAAQPQQLGPTGPASLKMVRRICTAHPHTASRMRTCIGAHGAVSGSRP